MATLQILGEWAREKDELNMDSNSWRAKRPNALRKDGGMSSGPAAPLLFVYLMADNNSHIWSGTQPSSSIDGASSVCWSDVEITICFWHVELANPGIAVHRNVSFGFDATDIATVVRHGFVWWISIWGTVQTLNDFPHIWSIWVRHSIV